MILFKVQYTDAENKELDISDEEYEKLSDKEKENFWQRYGEITQAAMKRYFISLGGSKDAIISDVKEILEAVTLDDFRQWQQSNHHLPAMTEHKEEYEQFCIFLFGIISDQLEAITFYKLPLDEMGKKLSDLIHKAAATYFKKPADFEFHLVPNNTKNDDEAEQEKTNITAGQEISEKVSTAKLSTTAIQAKTEIIAEVKEGDKTSLYSPPKSKFDMARQGIATNNFTKFTKTKNNSKGNTTIDPVTGDVTISQKDYTVRISNFEELADLKTSTHQLLDALTVKLTETGAKSPIITLSLEEYMEKRKIKDKKEARKQVEADLDILFNAKISFKEKRKKGKEPNFHDIRIIDSKGIKNGIITVSFGTAFYNILLGYPAMPFPTKLFEFNSKYNPHSYYLLRKISEHKYMNAKKKNENIIAVETLLSIVPDIPSYDEIMKTDRAVTRRIIEPFERDMDAFGDVLKWKYCHRNNTPLTDEELKSFDYNDFINSLIYIEWDNYPDQTARLERKAERQEQAKQKKKKTTAKA